MNSFEHAFAGEAGYSWDISLSNFSNKTGKTLCDVLDRGSSSYHLYYC